MQDESLGCCVIGHAHLDEAYIRELQGILDQVDENLLQSDLVSHKPGGCSGRVCRLCVFVQFVEHSFNLSFASFTLSNWRVQEFIDVEEEFNSLRACLHFKEIEHGLHRGFWVKPLQRELKFIFLEELVVEEVVDEVQKELGL